MSLKEKIANLLDAIADDRELHTPAATEVLDPPASEDSVEKFAMAYREITGEDLDDALRSRLESDADLRDAVAKVASRGPGRPTPLGEPAETSVDYDSNERPRTKEAAVREAEDRFARRMIEIGQR